MFVTIGKTKESCQYMTLKINMNKKILLFFFLCSCSLLNAQYTDIINSNRPGFSESPYSVGLGIYQLEAGLFLNSSQGTDTTNIAKSFGTNLMFRTSLFKEKLEINTQFSLQKDNVTSKNIVPEQTTTTRVSRFQIGAKYLVFEQAYEDKSKEIRSWKRRHSFDWKRIIPSISVYAGINTNFVDELYKKEKMTPKAGILLQNNLSTSLNVVTNLFYDAIGSEYAELSYLCTGTYAFDRDWSTFLEYKGSHNKFINAHNFGVGLAYLVNRHFQVDASTRLNFNGKTTEKYAAIGFSFRLDRHVVPYIEIDAKGNKIESFNPRSGNNKKFFGRFVDKIVTFFKFKQKKIEKEKAEKNTFLRKRPARKRIQSTSQKAIKKDTKKKKGGFFSFLKGTKKKTKKKNKKKVAAKNNN